MTGENVLLVTIDSDEELYEDGLEAIRSLKRGKSVDQPATVTFPNEKLLGEVFNERTYTLLRVIREENPDSIRETARLVDRDKKNVHEELTTLAVLGIIRFDDGGRSKKPVFPYTDLLIKPFRDGSSHSSAVA